LFRNLRFVDKIHEFYLTISLQFWHQEYLVDVYSQSILGPNFVYRGKKWFTTQIGIGYLIMPLSDLPKNYKQPPFVLMYSIGAYLPIR